MLVGLVGGNTYEFTWTIENGECTSNDNVTITVDAQPLDVDAGLDQDLCDATTTTLTATALTGTQTGQWTIISGFGASIVSPSGATTAINNLTAGNCYTFRWTVTDGFCNASDGI